jgi:hypothetical protein
VIILFQWYWNGKSYFENRLYISCLIVASLLYIRRLLISSNNKLLRPAFWCSAGWTAAQD